MKQKKRKRSNGLAVAILAAVALVLVVIVGLNRNSVKTSTNGLNLTTVENTFDSYSTVYTADYQDSVHEQVEELKSSLKYNLTNPLLIANPYNTVTNGIYVYFETSKDVQVQYVISCDGYEDYSAIAYGDDEDNLTKEHEFMMIGLVAGEDNTITINTLDESENVIDTVSFDYTCPEAVGGYNINQVDVTEGESTQELANGLYAILGNDVESADEEGSEAYLAMYDNNGVLRCEIPCVSYRAHRLLFDENGMYYSISGGRIVRLDSTGYVNKIYKLGTLLLHHDYIFGGNNDLLVLGSNTETGTTEDLILSIDLDSAEVTTLIDLKDIFPDYYSMTQLADGADEIDWMHINSIGLMDDNSIIISSRETSTLIKLGNIYDEPEVEYMIGSDNFWAGTGYEDLLLTQDGEFSLQAGQHSITYEADDSLPEGEYYLYMYNNNNTVCTTRPDYDWSTDDNYYNTGISVQSNGESSYYYKYLVDENEGTFTLVSSIPVDYSGYVSSVEDIDGNVVIDSGIEICVWEFDSTGTLIQQMQLYGEHWLYRCYKYDFEGYWFAKTN